ncbi:hypothetical protein [Comamonas sp. JC664]|uniref:hypothetical protein n=1 Tax=Comamonas sp. JC664 TaxID=2801917 RepID=UPI00174BE78B|nr:hypothetical protein [Comamonas sp. JC664]MBL0694038.1 hypothetical protein [Comamonas sp. JC664]GHG75488.1 hypothetical protein GCM10012319_23670 [Comamonas sp. KCTC 72670]
MTRTASFHPEDAATPAAVLHPLRDFAEKLGRELRLEDLRTGAWHARLVTAFVRHHVARQATSGAGARALRPSDTKAIIRRACKEAALVGASAAGVSTSATVFAVDTGFLGALVAVPVAGAAMSLDTMLRSIITARMTCDVASAFGVRIDPDDPWDFLHLHALSASSESLGAKAGADQVSEMLLADPEEMERKLGNLLLGEGVLRNILPFVGVATSSITSWRRTRRYGEAAVEYVRYRRALDDAFATVRALDVRCVELLIEGAWFLFNADGALRAEEAVMLAHLLRNSPSAARKRVLERLVEDDTSWQSRLSEVPESARDAFLHALEVVAAVDLSTSTAEWQLLRQAASALHRPLRRERVQSLVKQLRTQGIVAMARGDGASPRDERMPPARDLGLGVDAQMMPGAV